MKYLWISAILREDNSYLGQRWIIPSKNLVTCFKTILYKRWQQAKSQYSSRLRLFTFLEVPLSSNSTLSFRRFSNDSKTYEKFKFKSLDSPILITFLRSYHTLKLMSKRSCKSQTPKPIADISEEWRGRSISKLFEIE